MASVLVVGAGLAGLGCAWRLHRAGFDVEVVERAQEPGGRLRCERRNGYLLEPGTAFFTSQDRNLHAIVRHLGLETCLQSVLRYPDAVATDDGFSTLRPVEDPLFLRTRGVTRIDRLRLLRLRLEWMRWRHRIEPLHPEVVSILDAEELGAYLDRIVAGELSARIIAPYVSALLGLDSERLSAAWLMGAIDRWKGARPQYLVGGMDQISRRLAERLSIRFGCEVTSLESEEDGARLRYRTGSREGTAMADAVVVAVPGTQVASLCPKIVPSERGFFEGQRYAQSTVVHLLFDEAWHLPHRCVAFRRRKGLGLYGVEVAHHKRGAAPAGAGLLRVRLTQAASEGLWDAPDAAVGRRVLDDLASTPIGIRSPSRIVVHRQRDAVPIYRPGSIGRLERFANRAERSARLAFCGDYLVGHGADAALLSGMRAASQIAHALQFHR